jgi:hypothetical protein
MVRVGDGFAEINGGVCGEAPLPPCSAGDPPPVTREGDPPTPQIGDSSQAMEQSATLPPLPRPSWVGTG